MNTPATDRLWGKRYNAPVSYRVAIVRTATKEQALQEGQRQECTPFDPILDQQLRDGLQPGEAREIVAITAEGVIWAESFTTTVAGEEVQAEGVTSLAINGGAPASAAEAYEPPMTG